MTYFLEIHLDTSLESEDFAGVFKKKNTVTTKFSVL